MQGVRLILGQIEGIIGGLIRFGKKQVLPKFQPAIWMTKAISETIGVVRVISHQQGFIEYFQR